MTRTLAELVLVLFASAAAAVAAVELWLQLR
jgi:hypothetical protein